MAHRNIAAAWPLSCLLWAVPVHAAEPLTLASTLALARQRSPEVLAAATAVSEARGARRGATPWMAQNPTVSGGVGLMVEPGSPPWRVARAGPTALLEVSLPVEVALQRSRRVAHADALIRASVEQRQEAVRQSLWAAAQVFQRALAARELVGLAKLGSQLAHASHGAVSRRFQAGQVPGLDVRLADMERVAADQALGVAEADHRLVLAELSGITGLPPEEVRGVEGALVRNDPLPTREEAVVRAETRADVRALRAWALAAREDANVATAERFPTPQVRANYQYWHGEHSVLAGVELPLPIFARGQGQEARARARANGLLDEAEARQHRIRAEVAAVWDVANRLSAARRAYAQQDAGDIQQAVQDALRNYLERRMDMATLLGIQRLALQAARSALDLAAREAHARLWLDAAMGVLS